MWEAGEHMKRANSQNRGAQKQVCPRALAGCPASFPDGQGQGWYFVLLLFCQNCFM